MVKEKINIQTAVSIVIAAMNRKAILLGTNDSSFLTDDGYDKKGQYTTAKDMACIAAACLNNETLMEIMGTKQYDEIIISGQEVSYTNTNLLLDPNSEYYYPNTIGMKTGKSSKAGCCLISVARQAGDRILCVVMGDTEKGRWEDSIKLLSLQHPVVE